MRKAQLAPADTMGSQTWADKNEEPKTYRFQVLIAMMLSAMTRDQVTFAAMRRLQQRGCANLAGISAISEEELTQLLMPVRFNKRKAHFIKQTSESKFSVLTVFSTFPHFPSGILALVR